MSQRDFTSIILNCYVAHSLSRFDSLLFTIFSLLFQHQMNYSQINKNVSPHTPWKHTGSGGINPVIHTHGVGWWGYREERTPYPLNARLNVPQKISAHTVKMTNYCLFWESNYNSSECRNRSLVGIMKRQTQFSLSQYCNVWCQQCQKR